MQKRALLCLLCCCALLLTSCTQAVTGMFSSQIDESTAHPDLRLLHFPVYGNRTQNTVPDKPSEDDVLKLDLWLDASPVTGGVNPQEKSIYPHFSRKYREGGFHYRYEGSVGMYENVLRCMLAAAEGSRVRLLRAGNERLPDAFLLGQGVAPANASADDLRSYRRDMLTYAIDPMPTVFSGMSAEDMTGLFYTPGTEMLLGLPSVDPAKLENPEALAPMTAALKQQIAAVAEGRMLASGDTDFPLLYALDNLDLSRLSVITCDPAAIRRLSAVSADGTPQKLLSSLLERRGVFDAGLGVGLYAFTLDYMGQMPSFGAADFSEPLLWGRLQYNSKKNRSEQALPMPRTLLCLVIGTPKQLEAYTSRLNARMDADVALKAPRGTAAKDPLTYTYGGQTVAAEPFSFAYHYTQINRPAIPYHTLYSEGAVLTSSLGEVEALDEYMTVVLTPAADGTHENSSLTLALPLSPLLQNQRVDPASLKNAKLTVTTALTPDGIRANTKDAQLPPYSQVIALRDKLYLFSMKNDPFREGGSPFTLGGFTLSEDQKTLLAEMHVDGNALRAGRYRLLLSADFSGERLAWDTPSWIKDLNAALSNEQIALWEDFTRLITEQDRDSRYTPKQFYHAWGPVAERGYHGTPIPDCPPVWLAPGLEELFSQLESAAGVYTVPYIRYVFDIFVTGDSVLFNGEVL